MLNSQKYIVLKDAQETSKQGIYAVGDITDSKYKQAIIAAGVGAQAALQVQNFLDKIGYSQSLSEKEPEKTEQETQEKDLVVQVNNKKEFEKVVLKSKLPVIVDFYATWCLPCQKMAPIFDSLAKNYKGKIKFVKLNVSDNSEVADDMNIFSVPTFVFLKAGTELKRIEGSTNYNSFKGTIDKTF